MKPVKLILPYPPTLNHLYGFFYGKMFLKPEGKAYKETIAILAKEYKYYFVDKKVYVYVKIYSPDRRKRDVDNLSKILLDSLQYACVYNNDADVDLLILDRVQSTKKHGKVEVCIGLKNGFDSAKFFTKSDNVVD